jgi:hypothetical protein
VVSFTHPVHSAPAAKPLHRGNGGDTMKPLSTPEAHQYLRETHGLVRAPRTLSNLRSKGGGPEYHRTPAGEVRYTQEALDAYAREQLGKPVRHTAEERARGRSLSTMDEARLAREPAA